MGAPGTLRTISLFAASLAIASAADLAQKTGVQASPERTRQVLEGNARALESRGRPDLAIQIWQQILLSAPNNPNALAGLARDYKLCGNTTKADMTLDELRAVDRNDPRIDEIERLLSSQAQSSELRRAGDLARQGRNEDAMKIYRQMYGDHPPDGDIALGYYQALYGTASGKEQAVAAMRALLARNPGDPRYAIAFGRLLTYDPKMRADGMRILQQHPQDPDARNALRQALIWNSANPATAGELRAYLKEHPQDTEMANYLKRAEQKLAQMNSGVARQAPALPYPQAGQHLKEDARLQYAGNLMDAHRFDQAAALYTQILKDDANSVPAWIGLVDARHALGQDSEAIADVGRMPPSTYESALSDSRFVVMLGSIYRQANQYDIAQSLLERAVKLQTAAGKQPSMGLELQLAAIYRQRGDVAKAYGLYWKALTEDPNCLDAWKGLMAALQATNHTPEALQQLGLIPPSVRTELEMDSDFAATEAGIYAAAGDTKNAMKYMERVQEHYAQQGAPLPPSLAIQNAWLLYNAGGDRALYPALMHLGSRRDLTVAQREAVQTIWANWAVRRAGTALDNDENGRAVEILEAAQAAFPDNLQVKWILAGGYLRAGQTHTAIALYKKLPIMDATSDQFQGAIGAALAANDLATAEAWLRIALGKDPKDYKILGLAARFEQARGDSQRAADYWRASIAAMPANLPTDRLAHELAYPEEDTTPHKMKKAGDLQMLLNPDNAPRTEPFGKTVKLPPLPAYGPDPCSGCPVSVKVPPAAKDNTSTPAPPAQTAPTTSTQAPAPQPAHPVQLPPRNLLDQQPASQPNSQQAPQAFIPRSKSNDGLRSFTAP